MPIPRFSWVLGTVLSGVILNSCATVSSPDNQAARAPFPEAASPIASTDETVPSTATAQSARVKPQLVKTVELALEVKSVPESIRTLTTLVQQEQGDLLGLQDQPPSTAGDRHTASLQIRIPQARLENTLAQLGKLGTIQHRRMTAEDASEQLVDFGARLRNLRKTEQTLLEIMERSGSTAEVLKVAQELSKTREVIEQLAAQFQNLQNRVANSTINLTLTEVWAAAQPQRPVVAQWQEAWEAATRSLADLSIELGKLGIWLVVYTPYWLLIGSFLLWLRRRWRFRNIRPATPEN